MKFGKNAVYSGSTAVSYTHLLISYTTQMAKALHTKGLVNVQYVIYEGLIYVIEVNPRSSRTVPYISKVTGVPMVDLATRVMLGEKLQDMGWGTGLYPQPPYWAVKVPVFSFEKLTDVDVQLGPETVSYTHLHRCVRPFHRYGPQIFQ